MWNGAQFGVVFGGRYGKCPRLVDGQPAFYAVSPELMVQMTELYDERRLATLVVSRLKSVDRAVKVNLDDL